MILIDTLLCLALAIHQEARGEPDLGRIAVGVVMLNREVNTGKSPCDQLNHEGRQWTWDKSKNTLKRIIGHKDFPQSLEDASKTLEYFSLNNMDGITHFHAKYVHPKWNTLERVKQIGNHIFYRPRNYANNRKNKG